MSRPVSVQSMQSSRDPTGLDPSGIDVVAGADPPPDDYRESFDVDPPILPPSSPSGPPPPTPRRAHAHSSVQQQHGVRAPSPVMAFLVGDPPPPPPTPPPHKQRGGGSAARRHNHVPISPPGDASTTTGLSSLSSSIHPRREPREPLMDANMMSFVDQKRREALAIYESANLYSMDSQSDVCGLIPPKFQSMPPPPPPPPQISKQMKLSHEFDHQVPQRFEQQQMPPKLEETSQHRDHIPPNPDQNCTQVGENAVNTGPVDLDDDPFDGRMNSLASPRSAVTEPRSNKRGASRRNYKRTSSQESVDNQSSDSQSSDKSNPKKAMFGDANTSKKRRGRMSTGSAKVPKGSEKRGRGRSLERGGKRGETPERAEKKGFFRKIFGGGKKKAAEAPTTNVKSSKQEELTPVKTKRLLKTEAVTDTTRAPPPPPPPTEMPVLPPHKSVPSTVSSQSAPQLEDNHVDANFDKKSGVRNVQSKGRSNPLELETKPKERPSNLDTAPSNDNAKELELGMGLDTVTSGLTNDMEADRRDIFFAHDEVSTLTAPSAHSFSRRSVDPIEGVGTVASGNSSEPVGHYYKSAAAGKATFNNDATPKASAASSPVIDPFTEPFFREPDGESPITALKAVNATSKLQVDVPQTKDPAGEAPPTKHITSHMNEPSPRGWDSPINELKDPLGSTISESASKRTDPGITRPESASEPTISHELRREPSAFRDGSPYALDPPLRVQEGLPEEVAKAPESVSAKAPKSIEGAAAQGERIAVEPPTPTHSVQIKREELQPTTPTRKIVHAEPEPQLEPAQKENTENQAFDKRPAEETPALGSKSPLINKSPLTKKSPLIKKQVPSPAKPSWSPEKLKLSSANSPDATGFLDDLFQEKPVTKKRPSIVRPISISVTESARRSAAKMSQTQVVEIPVHRTQRLSGSPKSTKAAPWNAAKVARAEPGEIMPLPVPVPVPGSPQGDSPHRVPRLHRILQADEEEKKEQDNDKLFPGVDDASSKSQLATSTAALSTAVIQNARTVAYLHTLNGEPSPRHAWRRADLSDDEDSPVKSVAQRKAVSNDEYSPVKSVAQRKAVSNVKAAMSKKRAIAVKNDEDAFDSFIKSSPVKASPSTKGRGTGRINGFGTAGPVTVTRVRDTQSSKPLVVASKSKHSRNQTIALQQNSARPQPRSQYGAHSPRSRKTAREKYRRPLYLFRFNRDVRVTGAPLAYGLDLIRKKRIDDILNGYVVPVYKDKTIKTKKSPPPPFECLKEEEIKDPIQRAGRRLLSKAAIPIQSAARRYLAHKEALGRAHANLVLQSYFRRWKCEAFLIAYKFTCIKLQAAVRSWLVRCDIAYKDFQATQIQKVVRGYIAAAFVYDTIYWVSKLQAAMRGKLARNRFEALKDLRQRSVLCLQSWFRACLARRLAAKRRKAVCAIQAIYRSYEAHTKYQVQVVDIIITQSVVRQFLSRREANKRRRVKMNAAARKIQSTWRGFQGYTDYIFALVDILVLQRSMRKWLAKKRVNSMRQERAAIKIQAQWRRQLALIGMLYDLVHIIIAQSIVRRFLARKMLPKMRMEYSQKMKHQQMLDTAATKIQTAWRGFWGYSHFIIMQYEIIRLQAIIRGRASRILFSLKLGCCIMIQSAVRRYLASKKTYNLKLHNASLGSEVEGLRMKFACRKIQFWWRVVMECSKEKKAALVIERFFWMVKTEVDKEIIRQQELEKKEMQRAHQIRKQRSKLSIKSAPLPKTPEQQCKDETSSDADEKLLEKVWLNTVDENNVEVLVHPMPNKSLAGKSLAGTESNNKSSETKVRSRSAPRLHQDPSHGADPSKQSTPPLVKHRPSSPTMNLVMRHEKDPDRRRDRDRAHAHDLRARKEEALKASRRIQQKNNKPPQDLTLSKCASELSAITSPTVFGPGAGSGNSQPAPKSNGKKPTKSRRSHSQPPKYKHSKTFEDDLSLEESLIGEDIVEATEQQGMRSPLQQRGGQKNHFFGGNSPNNLKQHNHTSSKGKSNRRHSTSSITSEASGTVSEDISTDVLSQMFSRKETATTISRTTASRSGTLDGSGTSPRSEGFGTDVDVRKMVNQGLSTPLVDKKYGSDKYKRNSGTGSAALKGKRLLESVRSSHSTSSNGLSPRHGQIVVTNVPILSQDSRDNVEVEYGGSNISDQFGLI